MDTEPAWRRKVGPDSVFIRFRGAGIGGGYQTSPAGLDGGCYTYRFKGSLEYTALIWQKEASDKSEISRKRAKCVCHLH